MVQATDLSPTLTRAWGVLLALRPHISVALIAPLLASCAATSDYVLVGHIRPEISPDQVRVYSEPPPAFEEVAAVDASSGASLSSAHEKVSRAVEALRRQAAELGANGLVLQDVEDDEGGTVGAEFAKGNTTQEAPASVDIHTNLFNAKLAHGMAIYVPPE
jgi:hypothetical protein